MASACVNNNTGMSPERSFLGRPPAPKYSSFGWLSPRISVSREEKPMASSSSRSPATETKTKTTTLNNAEGDSNNVNKPGGGSYLEEVSSTDFFDFEFRLEDPVAMLPADELFSDGKLVPLNASSSIQRTTVASAPASSDVTSSKKLGVVEISTSASHDLYLVSPKAPRCSSRWKELLGLKKLYNKAHDEDHKTKSSSLLSNNNHNKAHDEDHKTKSSSLLSNNNHEKKASRTIRQLIHGRASSSSKPSSLLNDSSASLSTPLLKDSDSNDLMSFSSRLSLSSSSSSHDYDDLPRLSLDSDNKITSNNNSKLSRHSISTTTIHRNLSRVRAVKHRPTTLSSSENAALPTRVGRSSVRRAPEEKIPVRGFSVDSPRMNSSGKIVFHGLERSSSSPSTFNGSSHRYNNKHRIRGMERSYSAHVRVTPVLNVPVCSLRSVSSKNGVYGLFSQQKKDNGGGPSVGGANVGHKSHVKKNRTDRTSPRES